MAKRTQAIPREARAHHGSGNLAERSQLSLFNQPQKADLAERTQFGGRMLARTNLCSSRGDVWSSPRRLGTLAERSQLGLNAPGKTLGWQYVSTIVRRFGRTNPTKFATGPRGRTGTPSVPSIRDRRSTFRGRMRSLRRSPTRTAAPTVHGVRWPAARRAAGRP